jgi:hypothetical protein
MECEMLADGSALEMIAACFRHQHPEAFGGTPVEGPLLPVEVRYSRDDLREPAFTQVIREEVMGHPEAQIL